MYSLAVLYGVSALTQSTNWSSAIIDTGVMSFQLNGTPVASGVVNRFDSVMMILCGSPLAPFTSRKPSAPAPPDLLTTISDSFISLCLTMIALDQARHLVGAAAGAGGDDELDRLGRLPRREGRAGGRAGGEQGCGRKAARRDRTVGGETRKAHELVSWRMGGADDSRLVVHEFRCRSCPRTETGLGLRLVFDYPIGAEFVG